MGLRLCEILTDVVGAYDSVLNVIQGVAYVMEEKKVEDLRSG